MAKYSEGGTHTLSGRPPRQTSASRQRDKESGRGAHMLSRQTARKTSISRRGKGSRRWNSPAVMSIPQVNVSKPAARQGIQKVELAGYHVNPPGEHQQAGSAARDPEGGTHSLSCQSPRQTSASRRRGKGKVELTR